MSLTTLKRKTDGSYHVSGGLHGKGYVNRISSGRPAFSLTGLKYARPKQVCACPVVQPMTPLDGESYLQRLNGSRLLKESCENPPKKSGNCEKNTCHSYNSTFVYQKPIDYEQYLKRKHAPLPRGQEHYPPMVNRNNLCAASPNFSFLEFIQRLACR
jgi:hypothetical protein